MDSSDTLFSIAVAVGCTTAELRRLNRLQTSLLFPGQVRPGHVLRPGNIGSRKSLCNLCSRCCSYTIRLTPCVLSTVWHCVFSWGAAALSAILYVDFIDACGDFDCWLPYTFNLILLFFFFFPSFNNNLHCYCYHPVFTTRYCLFQHTKDDDLQPSQLNPSQLVRYVDVQFVVRLAVWHKPVYSVQWG